MTESGTGWQVACLCAAWCGTCREFEAAWTGAGGRPAVRFDWFDIEEHEDLLEEAGIDVETFPTLLIARAGVPVFFGPVTPHGATVARLVAAAVAGDLPTITDAAVTSLAARLAALTSPLSSPRTGG